VKNTSFWDMKPCSLVEIRRRSSETSSNFYQTKRRHASVDSNLASYLSSCVVNRSVKPLSGVSDRPFTACKVVVVMVVVVVVVVVVVMCIYLLATKCSFLCRVLLCFCRSTSVQFYMLCSWAGREGGRRLTCLSSTPTDAHD
jgi:hypothetical protein